jgi:hypothetical protein
MPCIEMHRMRLQYFEIKHFSPADFLLPVQGNGHLQLAMNGGIRLRIHRRIRG